MEKGTVYLLMEKKEKHSYWADRILSGIGSMVKELGLTLCASTDPSSFPVLSSKPVLVAGSGIDWLDRTVLQLTAQGAHPVIVNACMLPFQSLRCSGVVFELEEALQSCLESLLAKGKRRFALLGVRKDNAADAAKVAALQSLPDPEARRLVFWAERDLETCAKEFAALFHENPFDAVLCANDTVAIRLMHHLENEGINKETVDLVGIGNSYVGAGLGLSSVEFDYFEMGRAAVRLHQALSHDRTPCHMIVTLPCHVIGRQSAVLPPRAPSPSPRVALKGQDDYFHHREVENLIRVESMFQSGDETDRALLYGYAKGESSDTIAENLFFSGRAVRYRLNKLMKKYGFESRGAMREALKRAFQSNHAEDTHD